MKLAWLLLSLLAAGTAEENVNTVKRGFPLNSEYGGKSEKAFLQEAVERSSPGNARLLAELFGGFLELGITMGSDQQAVIAVGGAATQCQHQSPCFDSDCKLCYDPLLRIHGRCGGASYFTCRGTLPKACLPYHCTARAARTKASTVEDEGRTVFVKRFARYQDTFCLDGGEEEKKAKERQPKFGVNGFPNLNVTATAAYPSIGFHPRDLRLMAAHSRDPSNEVNEDPDWLLELPGAATPCQGYDVCLDLQGCNTSCYDSYLGTHVTCGSSMSYYDCQKSLPRSCRPMKCTDTDIQDLFSGTHKTRPLARSAKAAQAAQAAKSAKEADSEQRELVMVRNFSPLNEQLRNCV